MTRGWGGLVDLMPAGEGLGHRQWARLGVVVVLEDLGRAEDAGVLVCGIRADLEREAGRRTAAESARSARQARMAVRPVLPEAERGLNDMQARRIDRLLHKVGDKSAPKGDRQAARDKLTSIESGRRACAEQDALDLRFVELEALERSRDAEAVIEATPFGRRRILTRDGLESLSANSAITPLQYAAGMRYRDLFEATERSIKSNLNDAVSGSEDKRRLDSIGQKIQARKRLEAKVQAASKNGRGLTSLRLVAGEGRTIYAIAPKSNANQRLYRDALLIALDVCADHWGLQ